MDKIQEAYINKLISNNDIEKLIEFFYKGFKVAELKEEIEFLKVKVEMLSEHSEHFQEESNKFQCELELHKQLTNYYINK